MSDANSSCNLLSNFIVGSFTIVAAFGGIWLKDFLENKKLFKATERQKAIEAYVLANKLPHTLNGRHVICINLLQDGSYDYRSMEARYPDLSGDLLDKLETLIIENFYDLKSEFDAINRIIISQNLLLINIINKSSSINSSDFEARQQSYNNQIILATSELRDKLISMYINKVRSSFCSSVKAFFKFSC